MKIHSISITQTGETTERISALVDETEIWYEISNSPIKLSHSYDTFLLSSLALAIKSAEDIEVADDAGTSKHLISNLTKIMDIYCQWFANISKINIKTNNNINPKNNKSIDFVGCFFSGGVDGLYSYIMNESEITHLILCQGLDIHLEETQRWQKTKNLVRKFAETRGKEVITIKTNVKALLKTQLDKDSIVDNHGAILVSTALCLGIRKLIVPASVDVNNLTPWGSHLLTDPLYSNDVTEVVYDSLVLRSIKIKTIADTGIGMDILRVCNVFSDYNCGFCEKCLRTRLVLTLLGAECTHLEPLKSHELRSLKLYGETVSKSNYDVWNENLQMAKEYGRADFEQEIERILKSFRIRISIRQLDSDLLGGFVYKIKQLLRS